MAGWETDIDPEDDPVLFWAAWFNTHADSEDECDTCCYFGLNCIEVTDHATLLSQTRTLPPWSGLR